MLHKKLRLTQWLSLILLMIGVALVQWPETDSSSNTNKEETNKVLVEEEPAGNRLIGLLAVFVSCISSGFSGVYFEKLVKYTSQTLWIRNTQLALFSLFSGLIAMYLQDFDLIHVNGFFQVLIDKVE